MVLPGRVAVHVGLSADHHDRFGRPGDPVVDRDVTGAAIGGEHRLAVGLGHRRAVRTVDQRAGQQRTGSFHAVTVAGQATGRHARLGSLDREFEKLDAVVRVDELVLDIEPPRHRGSRHPQSLGHTLDVLTTAGQHHQQDPAGRQLSAEQNRGRLVGEVLLPVHLVLKTADGLPQLLIVLTERVHVVAQRVRDRSVEGRRADHQPDGQGEKHRSQRHHVVPKVDHAYSLLIVTA